MFLATTALEEFWNMDEPILFLADWCCRYDRRHIWEPLNAEVLPGPWGDREKYRDAYDYVKRVYEKTLSILTDAMNELHGVEYSVRYWRIVLGPWLLWFIGALYDRYVRLRDVLDRYHDITTWGLSESSYFTPLDTLDFQLDINDDPYNLQISTQVLEALGMDFQRREGNMPKRQDTNIERIGLGTNKTKILLKKGLHRILASLGRISNKGSRVIIRTALFTTQQELRLILKTKGKAWTFTDRIAVLPETHLDLKMRVKFTNLIYEKEEFIRIFKDILPIAIPKSFIEGFDLLRREALKRFPVPPAAVVSAKAWHHDEHFKVWAAECSGKGSKIVVMQHGGVYGNGAYLPFEDHEVAISDKFYSWGWARKDQADKICPVPSACPYRGEETITYNGDGVLFVTNVVYRYPYRFRASDQPVMEYIAWQKRFLDNVDSEIRKGISVRMHRKEFGWCLRQRLEDRYQDIKFEYWEIPFRERLTQCRLYMFDHNSSTFLEALSANKPTMLFCNPLTNELHPEASDYYDELGSVGILHDTPESAAAALNAVYDNVEAWWDDPTTQTVRKKFCHRFVRTSSNLVKEWAAELRRLADNVEFSRKLGPA